MVGIIIASKWRLNIVLITAWMWPRSPCTQIFSQCAIFLSRPTLEEIKDDCLSGRGGLCYTLNVFMKYLLDALGYKTYFLCSDIFKPDNHILVIVSDVRAPGDKFIVDVGMGYPNFSLIPLDFEEESPVYRRSFTIVKFVRRDGKILRYHAKNVRTIRATKREIGEEDWRLIYTIHDLSPKDLSFFDTCMDRVYTDINSDFSPFHKSFRATAFCGGDLRTVAIKNLSLLFEDELHCLQEVKLRDQEELLEKVNLHFPLLHRYAVEAVKNFNVVDAIAFPDL